MCMKLVFTFSHACIRYSLKRKVGKVSSLLRIQVEYMGKKNNDYNNNHQKYMIIHLLGRKEDNARV